MPTKTIILVTEENGSNYGEVTVLDDPREAERHVEALLEKGFQRESIVVLAGRKLDMVVTSRPVVSFEGCEEVTDNGAEQQYEKVLTEAAEAAESADECAPVAADSDDSYTRDGVRFSMAFARAY